MFSSSEILPAAESTGFKAEMVEKVLHLLNLLTTLNSHPFLKGKWALKGGTALNLFVLDLPRLSVDIDSTILTADTALQHRIQSQPLLEWKVLNVRRHKGLS